MQTRRKPQRPTGRRVKTSSSWRGYSKGGTKPVGQTTVRVTREPGGVQKVTILGKSSPLDGRNWGRRLDCPASLGPREPCKHSREWRNWQTHQLEGLAGAISWRFKSSLAHF